MPNRYPCIAVVCCIVFAAFFPFQLYASGISKPALVGPKAIGMGGAFVAVADDPSAIFHNPAGMVQMTGYHFLAGFDALIPDLEYTPAGTTTEETAETKFVIVPQFGFVTSKLEPMWLGLGVFFPHGNGAEFSSPSANPVNAQEGRIYSLEISPTIAYSVHKTFSIGGSVRIIRVSSEIKGLLFPLTPTMFDTITSADFSGWGVGGAVGILYRPFSYLSFGANYRTIAKVSMDGSVAFQTSPTLTGTTEQTLPTLVTAGVSAKPAESLTLALMYGFERNSEIDSIDVETAAGTLSLPQNFADSHTIHFGTDYRLFPYLSLRAGYAKDLVNSIPDETNNRIIGDLAAHEVSVGTALFWKRYSAAVTWNGRFGSRTVPVLATPNAAGQYDAFIHSISFALGVQL